MLLLQLNALSLSFQRQQQHHVLLLLLQLLLLPLLLSQQLKRWLLQVRQHSDYYYGYYYYYCYYHHYYYCCCWRTTGELLHPIFFWGALFFSEKVDDLFTPPYRSPQFPQKMDYCSAWGCTLCLGALTTSPWNLARIFFLRSGGKWGARAPSAPPGSGVAGGAVGAPAPPGQRKKNFKRNSQWKFANALPAHQVHPHRQSKSQF